jgi:acyl-CoA synthetase (AMP-forming)/AMP-acid ligase II
MAARRPPRTELALSQLRCAVVGGEIVRAETLAAFASAYRVHGFKEEALSPAYGLAELGVAATMTRPEQHWRSRSMSATALAYGEVREPQSGEAGMVLVASGQPLPGYEVACCSPDGSSTGEIVVKGPSIGLDGTTGESLATDDGGYTTGDTGFVDGDWLYVCGRIDDYIIARGRKVYAPAVEAAVGELEGVRPGRVTAAGLPSGEWIIVAEPVGNVASVRGSVDYLRQTIRRCAVGIATAKPDKIVIAPPGSLPLTSSGKLQRNLVRSRLIRRELPDIGR